MVLTKSELSGYFPWQKKNFKMDRRWISRRCGEPVLEKKSEKKLAEPSEFFARFLSYAAIVFADRGTADGIMEIYIYQIYIYQRDISKRGYCTLQ